MNERNEVVGIITVYRNVSFKNLVLRTLKRIGLYEVLSTSPVLDEDGFELFRAESIRGRASVVEFLEMYTNGDPEDERNPVYDVSWSNSSGNILSVMRR